MRDQNDRPTNGRPVLAKKTSPESQVASASINKLVIAELKAVQELTPLFHAQLMTYLKLSDIRLGFLINFNVPHLKDGIKRVVV